MFCTSSSNHVCNKLVTILPSNEQLDTFSTRSLTVLYNEWSVIGLSPNESGFALILGNKNTNKPTKKMEVR